MAHMDRALDILKPFLDDGSQSALLYYAGSRAIQYQPDTQKPLTDMMIRSFERLIDVNPMATLHLRRLGENMLPMWYGDYATLENEATKTAARLHDVWGAGGYSWVMMDAIAQDDEALAALDLDYFLDGLRDILLRQDDQRTVNQLAAFCSASMAKTTTIDAAEFNRAQIHACHNWIICDHLTEVHPLIWANASSGQTEPPRGRSREQALQSGAAAARRVLNSVFIPELARGENVIFTPEGPITELPGQPKRLAAG